MKYENGFQSTVAVRYRFSFVTTESRQTGLLKAIPK